MVNAILFDIDQTLLYTERANIKFYQQLLERCGYKRPPVSRIRPNLSLTMKDMLGVLLGNVSESELARVYEYAKSSSFYDYDALEAPSGEIGVLKVLQKRYRMGVVTSRIRRGAFEALRRKKILKYFDTVVAFEDYARPKPDPEPLYIGMDRLHVTPKDTVYIGDASSDMKAAHAAGIQFISYRSKFDGCRFRAMSYRQIPKILERLDKQ